MSKIPVTARAQIVARYKAGESYDEIAPDFATTPQNIGYMLRTLKEKGDPIAADLEFRKGRRRKEVAEAVRKDQEQLPLEPVTTGKTETKKSEPARTEAESTGKTRRKTDDSVAASPPVDRLAAARAAKQAKALQKKQATAETVAPVETPTAKAPVDRLAAARAAKKEKALQRAQEREETRPSEPPPSPAPEISKSPADRLAAARAAKKAKALAREQAAAAATSSDEPQQVEPVAATVPSGETKVSDRFAAARAAKQEKALAKARDKAAAEAAARSAEAPSVSGTPSPAGETSDRDWNAAAPETGGRSPRAKDEQGARQRGTDEPRARRILTIPKAETEVSATRTAEPVRTAAIEERRPPAPLAPEARSRATDEIPSRIEAARFGEARRLVEAAVALARHYESFVASGDERLIGTLNGEIMSLRREMNAIEIDILR